MAIFIPVAESAAFATDAALFTEEFPNILLLSDASQNPIPVDKFTNLLGREVIRSNMLKYDIASSPFTETKMALWFDLIVAVTLFANFILPSTDCVVSASLIYDEIDFSITIAVGMYKIIGNMLSKPASLNSNGRSKSGKTTTKKIIAE